LQLWQFGSEQYGDPNSEACFCGSDVGRIPI
jgi:hypothetical protein